MSMGYTANCAEVIETKTLGKIAGANLVEDFVQKYNGYDLSEDGLSHYDLNDALNDGKFTAADADSEALAIVRKAWRKLASAFNKATGIRLYVDYHSREEEGDRYDDVDGVFFYVSHKDIYQPTEKYKTMKQLYGQDVVQQMFFVEFC